MNEGLFHFIDGQNSDDIQQASQQLQTRWVEFCALLADRLTWLAYQTKVLAFYNLFHELEQAVANSENWLKVQQPPACEAQPLRIQLERCRVGAPLSVGTCAWSSLDVSFNVCLFCVHAGLSLSMPVSFQVMFCTQCTY